MFDTPSLFLVNGVTICHKHSNGSGKKKKGRYHAEAYLFPEGLAATLHFPWRVSIYTVNAISKGYFKNNFAVCYKDIVEQKEKPRIIREVFALYYNIFQNSAYIDKP